MSDPNTLRILEIDGGGERGLLPLEFLNLFVQLWGINFTEIWKYFDVICGTSIGGILTNSLAQGGHTYEELKEFFTEEGPYIFSLSSLIPSLTATLPEKIAFIAANTPFYQSSGITEDDYGAGLLYATVRSTLGTDTLADLKTNVIIPSYQMNNSRYVLFSNIRNPRFIGQTALASDVALATSAAPFYLPFYSFNDENTYTNVYADGGLFQNNPASFGRNVAQMLKPTANRVCILSLGTGLGVMGFDPGDEEARLKIAGEGFYRRYKNQFRSTPSVTVDDPYEPPSLATLYAQNTLFSIASTGAQEAIAESLYLESTYGTICPPRLYYYRFQPLLDPMLNTELDNTSEEILDYYTATANLWYGNDINNIGKFLGHLTA